jgi:hypothetical protein
MATRCITCNQPIPEGQEPEDYFAREGGRMPAEDDLDAFDHGVTTLFGFAGAVGYATAKMAITDMNEGGEPVYLFDLAALSEELANEGIRRAGRLERAGRIWQERAEAKEKKPQA